MPDGQAARRVQEWIREMLARLSPERRSRRSYSLTFVSKVLKRSTAEVRELVASGALSAGRTPSGRLVFSIGDLLAFGGQQPTLKSVSEPAPDRQGCGAAPMIRCALEVPSVGAELAARGLADGGVLEVSWQHPFMHMLVAAGRLEPDPDRQHLRFRDLLTGSATTVEFAHDASGRVVAGCCGCARGVRRLYRAQTGLLVCLTCAGLRHPTAEEMRHASALQETIGLPPGLPGAESP